jgi:hypothetical protein
MLREHEAGARTEGGVPAAPESSSATFYTYGRLPCAKKVPGSGLTVIDCNHYSASPLKRCAQMENRSHPPRRVVGLDRFSPIAVGPLLFRAHRLRHVACCLLGSDIAGNCASGVNTQEIMLIFQPDRGAKQARGAPRLH